MRSYALKPGKGGLLDHIVHGHTQVPRVQYLQGRTCRSGRYQQPRRPTQHTFSKGRTPLLPPPYGCGRSVEVQTRGSHRPDGRSVPCKVPRPHGRYGPSFSAACKARLSSLPEARMISSNSPSSWRAMYPPLSTPSRRVLHGNGGKIGNILTGKDKTGRSVGTLQSSHESTSSFLRIGRADDIEIWNDP